jgi:hypothetical protein
LKYCVVTPLLLGAATHSVGPKTVVRNTQAPSQTAGSKGTQCERSTPHGLLNVDGDKCTIESAIASANQAGNTTVIVSTDQMVSQPLTLTDGIMKPNGWNLASACRPRFNLRTRGFKSKRERVNGSRFRWCLLNLEYDLTPVPKHVAGVSCALQRRVIH